MNRPSLVLFDLDGVLVDSQDAEILALQQMAEQVGARLPASGFAELVAGRRVQESVDIIARFSDGPMPDDAVSIVRRLAEGLLKDRLRPVAGIERALRHIHWEKYVVSNSPLAMINDRLLRTGLAAHFRGPHFSAYELQTWKPAPDLYKKALEHLGIGPESAIAIEDSEVGVVSARDAGLHVYWYQPGCETAACEDSAAVRVFGDMSRLPSMLLANLAAPAPPVS